MSFLSLHFTASSGKWNRLLLPLQQSLYPNPGKIYIVQLCSQPTSPLSHVLTYRRKQHKKYCKTSLRPIEGSMVEGCREQQQQQQQWSILGASVCINRSSWIRWQPDLPSSSCCCISFRLHYWVSQSRLAYWTTAKRRKLPFLPQTFNWVAHSTFDYNSTLLTLQLGCLQLTSWTENQMMFAKLAKGS